MVRITYSPIEELVVHEVVEVPKDDLLRERITPQGNMPLYWCNGILFSFSSIPMTEEIIRDYLRGKVHWLEIHFAKEPKYTPKSESRYTKRQRGLQKSQEYLRNYYRRKGIERYFLILVSRVKQL